MSTRVRFQERPGITYVPSSRSGNTDLLADILSKPMPIIHEDKRYVMDACTAASIGDVQMLRDLLKVNPNTMIMKNQSGWTPLLYAAYLGHSSVTSFLLENGAKVDDSNTRWQTPLMMAAACGNINVVKLLLERGANPRICDKEKRQAIHYAASCCQNVVVDELLQAGCDPNAADLNGTTAVHEAAMAGHEVTFVALLKKGGSVEQKNTKGENASHLACDHNKILHIINEHRAEHAKSAPAAEGRGPRTLSELLEEMDLARYTEQFKHENVDLQVFFELQEKDFDDMRIAYGPKKRMLDVISRYRTTRIIRTDAFETPAAAAPIGYPSHVRAKESGSEDTEKVSSTLRSIKDLNQETKASAMTALEALGSGETDKIRAQLINIINTAESISLRVASHV